MNSIFKASSVALAISLALSGCSWDDDNDGRVRDLESANAALETENSALENQNSTLENDNSTLEGQNAALAAETAELQGALESLITSGRASTGVGFTAVKAPETDAEKRAIMASDYVVLTSETNGTQVQQIGYKALVRSGDKVENNTLGNSDDEVFGLLRDVNGTPIMDGDSQVISNSNEHTTLLDVHGKLFSISQFESRPGGFYLMELDQDNDSGELSVTGMKSIDISSIRGGWVHCAASRTPWKSHLASEEYEPDAAARDAVTGEINSYYAPMHRYYSEDRETGLLELNPYDYGFNIELAVSNAEGDVEVTKHYAMGRVAIELAYVMPDQKTVYITDDGTNVGLFMFIADTAGDLSAGTLYALKWNQTSSEGVGAANLEWVNLGHATNDQIQAYLGGADYSGNKVTFTDIFETADMVKTDVDGDTIEETGRCPADFTAVNTTPGAECLKIKEGMETAASRLETRRYAAMKGATTEFRKEEGFTFNEDHNKIYVAMSEVARGMESFKKNGSARNSYDVGGYNHIQLDGYNRCGAVYQGDINGTTAINDTDGTAISSQYVMTNMAGLIAGRPTTAYGGFEPAYDANGPYAANKCHLDGIANPDNITYMNGLNTLIIGEDTGSGHQNDVVWSFNVVTNQLTRIQTTPYGSETTSPYWYPFIDADGDGKGFGYLMSVVQHPYGESDEDKLADGSGDERAYTGYVGPFPVNTAN